MYIEKSYTEDEKDRIFAKGDIIAGKSGSEWRKDACGHVISRAKYGEYDDDEGWEVDHMDPKVGHVMSNLRPLQCKTNRRKGDQTPEEFGC